MAVAMSVYGAYVSALLLLMIFPFAHLLNATFVIGFLLVVPGLFGAFGFWITLIWADKCNAPKN
jgi:hypothetical protein